MNKTFFASTKEKNSTITISFSSLHNFCTSIRQMLSHNIALSQYKCRCSDFLLFPNFAFILCLAERFGKMLYEEVSMDVKICLRSCHTLNLEFWVLNLCSDPIMGENVYCIEDVWFVGGCFGKIVTSRRTAKENNCFKEGNVGSSWSSFTGFP